MKILEWYTLFLTLIGNVRLSIGYIEILIRPQPGLIYRTAPPNEPVLSVTVYETDTSQALEEVALTSGEDASYFKLIRQANTQRDWILVTVKTINKPVGFVFQFGVYGKMEGHPTRDKNVKVNVTERNFHAPSFEQTSYEFLLYRLSEEGTIIGAVTAHDADNKTYNSMFRYHILDPFASQYIGVYAQSGKLTTRGPIPDHITNVTFNVTAIDGGSPQLMNATEVTVNITDVPAPNIFCVAVEDSIARICWKDPTNGSYVMKYELLFQLDGQNTTKIPVHINGYRDETCSNVVGPQLQRNYTFNVQVFNELGASPDSVQRKVIVNRKGLYGDCNVFSNCSVWEPCQNGGECHVEPDLSYNCDCKSGWGGRNCTEVDLCPTNPCENNGTCVFLGDHKFSCQCSGMFYGNFCQYFNQCTEVPCQYGGRCNLKDAGEYECECPAHYIGRHCETPDPCMPSLCVHGTCSDISQGDVIDFACNCTEGYSGKLCQKENRCILDDPCPWATCQFDPDNERTWCDCKPGYSGEFCQYINPCEVGVPMCHNNATCVSERHNHFTCNCLPGYWGRECQYYNMCFEKPCRNGTCVNITSETFRCDCSAGQYGKLCEFYDPCVSASCETNSGVCYNVSNTEYNCTCPDERFGKDCQHLDGCKVHTCNNNGTCFNITQDGEIFCVCADGYVGTYCDDYDPCSLLPCQNGATCVNNSMAYICNCSDGFRGTNCELLDPCVPSPCLNQGTCFSGPNNNFMCSCAGKFFGDICQSFDFCSIPNQCGNGGTCTVMNFGGWHSYNETKNGELLYSVNITNWFSCECSPDSHGDRCQYQNECVSNPCADGVCIPMGDSYICHCPDGTQRENCKPEYCPSETTEDRTGYYHWPRTAVGEMAQVKCDNGVRSLYEFSLGHAKRYCALWPTGDVKWLTPDTTICQELGANAARRKLNALMSLTGNAASLGPDEVANVTSMLEELFGFAYEDKEIATAMTSIMGNLLEANESVLIESNSKNHSSDRLVGLLDEYTTNVEIKANTSIVTPNINLFVVNLTEPDRPFEYEPVFLGEDNTTQLDPVEAGNGSTENSSVSVKLPPEALDRDENGTHARIQFMTFRSSSFFIPSENSPPQDEVMSQWVVSAVVNGRTLENLTYPVELRLQNIKRHRNHTCVFWHTSNRTWSTEGMLTVTRTENFTECFSYHLTSFAILLDPSPSHALPEVHEKILTTISYIGCGISMIGLALTIITYSMFRCLNREKSGKILLNLCGSMLLMNAAFILGSESSNSVSGDALCKAVSVLLHYFLLTTLLWMCIEAINMYQALITVFTKYARFFMLKRCIAAWGIPAVIVIVTLAIDDDNYKSRTELCFLSHANPLVFYIGLLGPACLILLINFAVFIMVSRVILKPRFKGQVGSNDTITPAQVRGAFTVMTLLGVTWVFGPFAINEAKLVVNYVFTVLNSLQGFLIFVFRCLFNPEARMAWTLLIKTGQFKSRRGPLKPSDTTTLKGDSKSNGSLTDTQKSNVYTNSVGKQRNVNVLNNDRNFNYPNHKPSPSKNLNSYFDDLQRVHHNGNNHHNEHNRQNGTTSNGSNGIASVYHERRITSHRTITESDDNTKL